MSEHDDYVFNNYFGKKDKKLHEYIAVERWRKGYSTKQVALAIDYPESEYIKLEKNEIPITKDVLNDIINYLKLPKKIKKLAYDNDKPMYAKRLAELRIKTGFTMQIISSSLNINIRTYASYENGEREMPYKKLIEIADYYNISLDYLLGRTNIREDFEKL